MKLSLRTLVVASCLGSCLAMALAEGPRTAQAVKYPVQIEIPPAAGFTVAPDVLRDTMAKWTGAPSVDFVIIATNVAPKHGNYVISIGRGKIRGVGKDASGAPDITQQCYVRYTDRADSAEAAIGNPDYEIPVAEDLALVTMKRFAHTGLQMKHAWNPIDASVAEWRSPMYGFGLTVRDVGFVAGCFWDGANKPDRDSRDLIRIVELVKEFATERDSEKSRSIGERLRAAAELP